MRPISNDLRERVVRAVESGQYSQLEISEQYQVSLSFVEKLWHRYRYTGDITPTAYTPGRKRTLAPHGAWIRQKVAAQPDLTLQELCDQLDEERHVRVAPSMMWRELARLELPLKKSRSTTTSATRRG
jgi:putative transposase